MKTEARLDLEANLAKLQYYRAKAKKDLHAKQLEVDQLTRNLDAYDKEIEALESTLEGKT